MRRLLLPLLLLAAAAAAVAWLRREPPGPAAPEPRGLLLVTIDTMRGDAAVRTPALAGFRAEATLYPRARTPIPLTLPAHLSILTGLEPRNHGVHDNAAPPLPAKRAFPMLQEEFRERGFLTAAFCSCAVLGAETGIASGFSVFECPPFGPAGSGEHGDLPAEERVKAPLQWLGSLPEGARFFLLVHFFDPHDPYLPFPGDGLRAGTRAEESDAVRYGGEVRRTDAALERLLLALPEGTAVVIASDHGESLGEHGEPTHGTLCYGTTADVFLAARAPGLARAAEDPALRSLCDVAPAARRWFGLEARRADGIPLGLPPKPPRILVTESLLAFRTHGWGQCFAATDGRYSLVESGPRSEFFDRAADPGERNPLDPRGSEAYERLDRALAEFRASGGTAEEMLSDSASPYGAARRPVSGYLPRAENARLPDPATRFGFSEELSRAKRLQWLGRAADAAAILERLAAEEPGSPLPHHLLALAIGKLAVERGDPALHAKAAAAAREAIARGYAVAPSLHLLLEASLRSGDPAAMASALETALDARVVPDLPCARLVAEAARGAGTARAREAARLLFDRARPHLPSPAGLDELAAGLR